MASTRRPAPTRTKQRVNTPGDQLADKLSSLTISKPKAKGKEKATLSPEEQRVQAMRAVNSASQELSSAVQSGWRKSADVPQKKSPAFVSANASATLAAKHLALLREISPGDLDIERAAGSVLGKLVTLELFDAALLAVQQMHPRLCTLLEIEVAPSTSSDHLYLLSIPPPETSPDPIVLTLVTTFLLHALTTISHLALSKPTTASSFADALTANATILAWASLLATLPSSHADSVLTRAYSSLIKVASVLQTNPKTHRQVFLIRDYALSCLAHTAPGKIEPRSFWDQSIKSAGAYVKTLGSAPEDHDDATPIILNAFKQIIVRIETRADADIFMSGKGFIGFCECWMGFANRMGDIATLDRIARFIGNQPGTSKELVSEDRGEPKVAAQDSFVLECTQLCATLAQTTALLDPKAGQIDSEALSKRIRETTEALSRQGAASFLKPAGEDEEATRLSGKLQRAIERTRRSAVKLLDTDSKQPFLVPDVHALLEALADILERTLRAKPTADAVTAVLDTLFVLARTKLNVHDPHTHVPPHAILKRAAAFLEIEIDDVAADKATYARCISGAFHNLAGTLYQAGKHGAAIRYLQDGCTLGRMALDMHAAAVAAGKEDEPKMTDAWRQLEEQLWRRWELLGVCYSKIGDRKLAFESFLDCIKGFPYSFNGIVKQTQRAALGAVFEASPAAVQLGTIVDRVTYLGACELLLAPEKVSLVSLELGDTSITGALIERQIQSLDGSRWKESTRNVVQDFLRAALDVYGGTEMPVRRARILVRCLEFAYHAGPETLANLGSPAEMGDEVERILVRKNLGQDSDLSPFCAQYRASAHLWLALHAHRRADLDQSAVVANHVRAACKILEPAAGLTAKAECSPKTVKKPLPKQTVAASKRVPVSRRVPAPRKAASVRDPVTPQRKVRNGVLPPAPTPPKIPADPKKSTPFDDFHKFSGLLQLITRILGLLTHVLLKVHILDITRRLCEQSSDSITDDHVSASVELALEYMKLGKIKRATFLFTHTLNAVKSGNISEDVCVMFYLRHAESLALAEDASRSSDLYNEALVKAQRLGDESKGMTTLERVQCRVGRLERAAVAAHVFALIQHSREDIAASLEAMLQSLRLWNRAVDTLARLNPPASKPVEENNPFDMSAVRDALPNGGNADHAEQLVPPKVFPRRTSMGGLQWRISEGLLATLFALCEAYFTRGSAREAEYFAQQAYDLAQSLNAPAMAGRALAKKGELQLHQRLLEDAHATFMQAAELLQNLPGKDTADIQRLCGDYNQLSSQDKNAQQLYEEATRMLEELDQTFGVFDGIAIAPRKSVELATLAGGETLLPELFAAVLRQHIWLLRNDGHGYELLLQRFLALPAGSRTKAQENALMAKLTLHEVYGRFRTDMFLSSLTESTIALPMGMSTDKAPALSPSAHDILHTLDHAEQLFWLDFTLFSRRGDVSRVRDAVVSLALIRALQTSLGKSGNQDPVLVAGLLDVSTSITLGREMLEAIQHKFPAFPVVDDLQWPLATRNGSPLPRLQNGVPSRFNPNTSFGSELDVSDDEIDVDERSLRDYWESVRSKYQSQAPDISTLSASQMAGVPQNWTVVHISVTDDKSTLFVTRQHGGDVKATPLVFCVPLKGRRDDEEDEHLTFEDALREFNDIVKLSDEGTRGAVHVKDDPEARARWWKERTALDTRMRELLENIEFCWLGAFKTILSPRANLTAAAISDLRIQFDKIFHRGLRFQDKKVKAKPAGTHKRLPSETQIPSKVALDDVLLECFSTLSPKCRDEELEDLVFFILDLYQFHGVPVAIAEVDIDQVVVDLRGVLEEHHARLTGRRRGTGPAASKVEQDEHMFLVLDKNVQGLPWESIPILRGKSISRIPSVDFLLDRVQLAGWLAHGAGTSVVVDRAAVDPHKGYCILNPSGDLVRTEGRFKGWVEDMEKVGWKSVVGHAPSEQQFLDALRSKDLVVYFGHGGAEQYLRSHKIRNLPRCAATMLWGCSSGSLREMGDFDRVGTPYNYMLAGCPTLVANIWDVTDRDIDMFSQSVFDKLSLNADSLRSRDANGGAREGQMSLVAAVAQSRSSCKLKYLTGAAPVVYGIPFYL
ncbi:peptidase family C50-domain-containing protein [Mycena rosella]|uniref:separase n=1 Tax=Mycena rosella TaxID=1033263 RepID=A0AAD7H0V8_MYCRO|nr:peptidase family C50-domain-containing protein [Mycena rosella]